MKIHAYKYQGAGNDFVILDNRKGNINLTYKQIKLLCDRRFGIGGDGFMLLGKSKNYNFSMRYFNADGKEGTMCGNGGRCIVAFAARMGVKGLDFEAIDGFHTAQILKSSGNADTVRLKMIDPAECRKYSSKSWFLNTGSPHYVEFVKDVKDYPVDAKGKFWRYHKDFKGGTNVNFVQPSGKKLNVRTYERGVEAETFACGTGATASAVAAYMQGIKPASVKKCKVSSDEGFAAAQAAYNICMPGGNLSVEFTAEFSENSSKNKQVSFSNVWLTGPATFVYDCFIEC